MNNSSKKILIFIIISISLVISAIGISYAFLYAVAVNSDTILGRGETIDVELTSGSSVIASQLIPASEDVVDYAFAKTGVNQCIDSEGFKVCSVYNFTVTNNSNIGIDISGSIVATTNEFTNLKYKVIRNDSSDSGTVNTVMSAPSTGNSSSIFTDSYFDKGQTGSYTVIIWLNEANQNQKEEMDKNFIGTINIQNSIGIEVQY